MRQNGQSLATPLARARGLGSAKRGVGGWRTLRLTAIVLVPLTIWFVASILCLLGAPLEEVRGWIARPWNATLLILFIAVGAHHGAHGMTEVWDDYCTHWTRLALDIVTKALCALLAVAAIVSVLMISVGS